SAPPRRHDPCISVHAYRVNTRARFFRRGPQKISAPQHTGGRSTRRVRPGTDQTATEPAPVETRRRVTPPGRRTRSIVVCMGGLSERGGGGCVGHDLVGVEAPGARPARLLAGHGRALFAL